MRRWTATAIGFVGVLIMLRPSSEGLDIYALLAVAGAMQGKGVGTALVAEAHRLLKPRENLSVVLGEPGYYGRFGYEHARAAGFSSAYQCEALQALAWSEEAPFAGRLVHAAPFAGL